MDSLVDERDVSALAVENQATRRRDIAAGADIKRTADPDTTREIDGFCSRVQRIADCGDDIGGRSKRD